VVKLTRSNDIQGKLRVQLVMPGKGKGISAEEVVVPAGKDEARMVLRASKEAALGKRSGVLIRLSATSRDGTAMTQDIKFSLEVVK
jgi:hypothetical protein